ncbi:putative TRANSMEMBRANE LIPOPROTEIN [Cupriavidus phytorum]|uniref:TRANSMEMBRANE LIPOPROTEIN n=1 Tax=Cupriavidus taiwanensis TaxID=164546 RepID=A0A375BDK4_9BURK|nr:hypothetical protein [Cupriavidus taiwanensis]SOY41696.1 putative TRANSMEMBRANE LIPOPROTEIN [Cupriavidus taiwanensis]
MNSVIAKGACRLVLALGVAMLSACATLMPEQEGTRLVGQPQAAVQAMFGPPTDVFPLRDGTTRWIYSKQPMGQYAYGADFDRNGNLTAFRNMLSTPELYKAQVNTWTRRDVAEHFGMTRLPVSYYPRMRNEVWSYRFRHEDVWPSLFHFYFDDAGVLRRTQITPDPLYDPDERRLF